MLRRAPFRLCSALAILLVATLVCACAGGGGSQSMHPATIGAAASSRHTANVTVKIPAGTKLRSSARGRTPLYVSPGTLSTGFLVYPANSGPASGIIGYADLSATSSLCTATAGGRLCSFVIDAPVGNDTFVMTLFDQPLAGGVVPSGAAPLSTQTVDVTISANVENTIPFNLSGIPASVVLNPLSMQVTPGAPNTYALAVVVRDADGYILTGTNPYTTPVTLTVSGDTGHLVSFSSSSYVASLQITDPSMVGVTLYYNGLSFTGSILLSASGPPAGTTMQITPSVGSGTGGITVPSFTTSAIATSTLSEIASFRGNAVGNAVPISRLVRGTAQGNGNFAALAADSVGNLYTLDTTSNSVAQFLAPFQSGTHVVSPAVTFALPAGYSIGGSVAAIAVDSYNNIYVAASGQSHNAVLVYAPGNSTPVRALMTNVSGFYPAAIALDSNNNLYVADFATSGVEEYAAGASGTAAPLATITNGSSQLTGLQGLAIDTAGNVFVTSGANVVEFARGSSGSVTPVRSFLMDGCTLPTRVIVGFKAQPAKAAPFTQASGIPTTPIADIAVDQYDYVYAAGAGEVCVYAPSAQGTTSPVNTITGSNTGLKTDSGTGIVVMPTPGA